MDNAQSSAQTTPNSVQASKEDLDRLLAIGKLLFSVLTDEEIEALRALLAEPKIGNTSVT